jgi:hypothetical protein
MHKSLFVHFSIALAILLLPHLAGVETWYVKKSATKLQAEASAHPKYWKMTPIQIEKAH